LSTVCIARPTAAEAADATTKTCPNVRNWSARNRSSATTRRIAPDHFTYSTMSSMLCRVATMDSPATPTKAMSAYSSGVKVVTSRGWITVASRTAMVRVKINGTGVPGT
jgi:hypothetical protein